MKRIIVYTDGACSGNPGPGGWAAILRHNEHEKEISGGATHTTNNRMEIEAAIQSLAALKEKCVVEIHTDSAYLANAFNQGWLQNWKRNGWKTSKKKPVENQDLWEKLTLLTEKHRVKFVKVKGHSDDVMNNRADELAVAAMLQFKGT